MNLRLLGDGRVGARFDDQLAAMVAARDEGLIAGVGLSNVSLEQLRHAVAGTGIVCVQNLFARGPVRQAEGVPDRHRLVRPGLGGVRVRPQRGFLIITRVLQGIGGALLTPGSLAILETSFTPADRARAIGAWSGLGGVAIAAGPLIGGYLISAASWRWIFFINVPIAAVVVALGARHIPESRDPSTTGRLDYAGALAAVVFLSGITFAFIEAPTLGWASPAVLTMALLGVAGLASFLAREHRAAAPMLPLSIFRERQFAAASAVTFIVYGALTGATFLLPLVLQVVSGYSPLASGLALVPLTVIMLVLSARSGQLAAKIGPRLQLSVGPVIAGAGLAMLTFTTSGSGYVADVLPAVVVFGVGMAITVAPLTATATGSAPAQHAGIGSFCKAAIQPRRSPWEKPPGTAADGLSHLAGW